jgi:hypothetical protein
MPGFKQHQRSSFEDRSGADQQMPTKGTSNNGDITSFEVADSIRMS